MKILILGGTGFISSKLASLLHKDGHELTLLTRGLSRNNIESMKEISFVHGERNDSRLLNELIKDKYYDVVYDMIAYEEKDSISASKIFRGKIGRFIHCSTISVYMVSNDVQCPITEDQDRRPLMDYWDQNPFGMDYGIKKRECEKVLWDAHHDSLFPVSVLRPTFVCGPADPTKRDFFWIERIMDGEPVLVPGNGEVAFQNVYIDDVAKTFVDLLKADVSMGKSYNVAAEEIFTLNKYLRTLGHLLGKSPELVHVDQEIFDQQSFSHSLEGDVFPYNTRRTSIFSLDKIKSDLGYTTTDFSSWMKLTIDWFNNNFNGHSVGYEKRDEEIKFIKNWRDNEK